jgi:hypothetical protein
MDAWFKAQLERNKRYRRMLAASGASKALSLSVAAGTKRITLPGDAAPDTAPDAAPDAATTARKLAGLDRTRHTLELSDLAAGFGPALEVKAQSEPWGRVEPFRVASLPAGFADADADAVSVAAYALNARELVDGSRIVLRVLNRELAGTWRRSAEGHWFFVGDAGDVRRCDGALTATPARWE